MTTVPCGKCQLCCQNDAVTITAEEAAFVKHEPHTYVHGALMIAHKEDGSCFYLGERGCEIHDRKPQRCQDMDCRRIAATVSYEMAEHMDRAGLLSLEIWRMGKKLLGG